VPVVVTVHGNPRIDLRSRISEQWPARIIFVSKRHLADSRMYNRIKEKSVFIQNGVKMTPNLSLRDFSSFSYVSRIDSKHAALIILLVKEVLPSLLKDFPDITFHIMGDGKQLEEIRREVSVLNEKNNREICLVYGFVAEVEPLIRKSGLVLGVGRAAINALSMDIPVLSVNQQFLGEFITRENYKFYQENNFVAKDHSKPDAPALIRLLREYFEDPGRFHDEAKKLRSLVREDFDLENIILRLNDLYKSLTGS
jgi:glycosyltransferase involved in cell wall biosynthesis